MVESISHEQPCHAENLLNLQAKVLEQIAIGGKLKSCLDLMCKLVQQIVTGSICSVMLLDDERKALFVEAAPDVPEILKSALDGLVPCENAGSCGTAVFLDEPVYVTNTLEDPRWFPLKHIAEQYGIRACWSIPVRSRTGEIYGSFAISHLKCRTPDEHHKELLRTAAHLAGIGLDRDRNNRELEAAKLRAEDASRAKTEFLANVSHEIRTPLTAILGYADLIADSSSDSDAGKDFAMTIRNNAEHLMTVIDDIMDAAKIEAGRMQLEMMDVRLPELMQEINSTVKGKADQKGITLDFSLDDSTPEFVQTDPTRLRQILLNIIDNAIKFTDAGSVQVRTRCVADGELLQFEIIDTGIGMSEEQVQRISQFHSFQQADNSTTRMFGGTGLGLMISNKLARMLGGQLGLTSLPGEGSTFTMTLPIKTPASAPLQDSTRT